MALKVEENPPELLAPLDDPLMAERQWCVALTRSRQEKKLAWYLAQRRIQYFLPMVEQRTVSRNLVRNPLFAGILFLSYDPHDGTLDEARASHCVSNFLFTRNQPRLKQELALIASETCSTRSLRPEPRSFRTGDSVKFASGPMRGLEGRVARSPDSRYYRLYVDLILLGRKVSVELNDETVKHLEAM